MEPEEARKRVDFWKPLFELGDWSIETRVCDVPEGAVGRDAIAQVDCSHIYKWALIRIDRNANFSGKTRVDKRGEEEDVLPPNTLDIVVLHELGHIIFDEASIPVTEAAIDILDRTDWSPGRRQREAELMERRTHEPIERVIEAFSRIVLAAYQKGVADGRTTPKLDAP